LELSHRDLNGPLLVKNCEVIGFRRGITAARAVNSQVFEHIALRGQTEIGFSNEGQPISIRGLTSHNTVPALGTYGTLLLTEAVLTGAGHAANAPAIINYNFGRIYLRDVRTSGYKRVLADMPTPDFVAAYRVNGEDKPGSLGPNIVEYSSTPVTTAFPSPDGSIRLPVRETPAPVWDPPATWAVVDAFGADPTGKRDSAEAIARAMNSGAATVFFHVFNDPRRVRQGADSHRVGRLTELRQARPRELPRGRRRDAGGRDQALRPSGRRHRDCHAPARRSA